LIAVFVEGLPLAVQRFARAVRAQLGPIVTGIVLFGSHARHTSKPDSDVDVVVFVSEDAVIPEVRCQVSDITYEFVLRGIDIRPIVVRESQRDARTLLMGNIRREGRAH
jgi:predicted nucleotidyltransferase